MTECPTCGGSSFDHQPIPGPTQGYHCHILAHQKGILARLVRAVRRHAKTYGDNSAAELHEALEAFEGEYGE